MTRREGVSAIGGGVWLWGMLLMAPLPAEAEAARGKHLLVKVEGQAQVRRKGTSADIPARYGMVLARGDLLKPKAGAQLTVVCGDATLATVKKMGPLPCRGEPTGSADGADKELLATRTELPVGIPVILSPRATLLLDKNPLLRWMPVRDATRYKVTLSKVGSIKDKPWVHDVTDTTGVAKAQLRYPPTAPELLPGRFYLLRVEANGQSSDKEDNPNRQFSLMEPGVAESVKQTTQRLQGLQLSPETTRFLIASLYVTHNLLAEGIEQLENKDEVKQEPAVARLLGEAYHRVGLHRLAETHLRKALELSTASGDEEGVRMAEQTLASVYTQLGIKNEQTQPASP